MRRAVLSALGCGVAAAAVLSAQSAGAPAVGDILARVGESVTRYFEHAQNIICLETIRLQNLGSDLMTDASFPRRLEYELRVEWDPAAGGDAPPANVVRQLLKVNGRTPRPKDEPGCLDPASISPEPLAMLLPAQQDDFNWSVKGTAKVDGRSAVMIDYTPRHPGPITASLKQEDCFSIDLPGHYRGRVWVDTDTFDVLRVDERLDGMHDIDLPRQRRRPPAPRMTLERHDTSIRYRAVSFTDPDETLMLPASIESFSVVRNSGSPRVRMQQAFSNYRRFVTEGHIVQ